MQDEIDDDAVTEEASTLGFKPGEWPAQFSYDGQLLYRIETRRDNDGDVAWVVYANDGAKLVVFND